MILYLTIIGIISLIIILFSVFTFDSISVTTITYTILMIILHIALVTIIDGIIAFFVNKLPKKWFNYEYKRFHIFKWEKKFYEFIKIKKWKDHVPELGQLANFRKNKIEKPKDIDYLKKFIEQCCYGEIVHLVSIFLGFLIIFVKPNEWMLFGVPVSLGNALLNYMPYAILRYNRHKLEILYKRNLRKGTGVNYD